MVWQNECDNSADALLQASTAGQLVCDRVAGASVV